ncbi:hypothetical protein ACEPPN_010947 [Leptodophora sp. 'Broadleaf-Isolate-01']
MSGLIFITGATGFIGSTTAKKALEKGYKLRISVRKEAQIEKVRAILGDFKERLDFVVVSDITNSKAFAGKLNDVDYVLHMASPLPGPRINKAEYFGPSVDGTTAILAEAAKVSSIKKVVITSSIAALMPMAGPTARKITDKDDQDLVVDKEADFSGKTDEETSTQLYHASKILSNQASWRFMKENSPNFVLIALRPSFVYGHNLTQTTAQEISGCTNAILWGAIMAENMASILSYVHIGDVADAHIRSLDPKIKESTSYVITAPAQSWDDVLEVVKRDYPNVPYKLKPGVQTINFTSSTQKAEKELGMKWTSIKDTVHEVMDQQLGLLTQAAPKT